MTEKDGLPSAYVTSLSIGKRRELWATMAEHVIRINTSPESTIVTEQAGLPAQTYRAITRWENRIVAANDVGISATNPDTGHFERVSGVAGRVTDLFGGSPDLILSGFKGVARWDGAKVLPFYETPYDAFVIFPVVGSKEFLISDNRSIVAVSPDGASRKLVTDLPDIATSIGQDERSRLWLGTFSRGLLVATPADVPTLAQSPAASFALPGLEGHVRVRSTPEGAVLVLADNGAWLKPVGSERFAPVAGYPSRKVDLISNVTTGAPAVWIVHAGAKNAPQSIGRIEIFADNARWQQHSIDALPSIGSARSLFADVDRAGSTTLWIGGSQSVLRHEVGTELSAPVPAKPLLRAYARRAANEGRKPIESALPYSIPAIEFEFAAPEYSRRALLRIESRVDGIDDHWVPAGPGSRRELTGIRDGRYLVRARVVAETGIASEETTFGFQVLPPWWRTTPILFGVVLALAPLTYGFFRLRVRALRIRNAELETKVRIRTRELEAANATKTQFVANISHDIRNPLNGIVGLALALEDTRLDRRQREIVSTLQECTTYLSSLVDDVLDFASIEAGKVELRPGPFPPAGLLRSIVTTVKSQTAERGATIIVEADPDLPENLLGDAGRIQQILVNYVSNALKYAGGHIRLSAAIPADGPGEVEFAVTDEGPGISEPDQAMLFRRFSRLSGAIRHDIPGTGLGLASCRLLADIMGGSVGVASIPGQGARFFLRLPLVAAVAPPELPAGALQHTTVLLVEDTDYNAWAASAVLGRLGLTCERARTGAEALRLFREKRYNVVLLDRNLPDMDGTEVARQMRETESEGSRAVLLAVTAYCTASDRDVCLQAGMDAFVGKPLTPEKLRKALRAAGRQMLASASVQAPDDAVAAPDRHPLDLSLLNYLAGDAEQGLERQIERFLASLAEAEAGVIAAGQALDYPTLSLAAHEVVSRARMVGDDSLMSAAAGLEHAAKARHARDCADSIRVVRRELARLTATLRHHRSAGQRA